MYRKILIATDGSDLANKAVDHGVMLAKGTGASVVFVTVTENWSAIAMGAESTQGMSNPIESYEAIATKRAQNILAAAKTAAKDAGIECETVHVPDQPPAEGIIETANLTRRDAISLLWPHTVVVVSTDLCSAARRQKCWRAARCQCWSCAK
jgi:nucleotide-binding universal stress UspA family protein